MCTWYHCTTTLLGIWRVPFPYLEDPFCILVVNFVTECAQYIPTYSQVITSLPVLPPTKKPYLGLPLAERFITLRCIQTLAKSDISGISHSILAHVLSALASFLMHFTLARNLPY